MWGRRRNHHRVFGAQCEDSLLQFLWKKAALPREAGRPWEYTGHEGKSVLISSRLVRAWLRRVTCVGVGRDMCWEMMAAAVLPVWQDVEAPGMNVILGHAYHAINPLAPIYFCLSFEKSQPLLALDRHLPLALIQPESVTLPLLRPTASWITQYGLQSGFHLRISIFYWKRNVFLTLAALEKNLINFTYCERGREIKS